MLKKKKEKKTSAVSCVECVLVTEKVSDFGCFLSKVGRVSLRIEPFGRLLPVERSNRNSKSERPKRLEKSFSVHSSFFRDFTYMEKEESTNDEQMMKMRVAGGGRQVGESGNESKGW